MELHNQQTNGNMDIDENAELGYGCLLVVEDEAGGYEPVALVSTVSEARDLVAEDFRLRLADVESGNACLCPARYAIWVRRSRGYTVLTALELE